ncbi:MAG TPA: hypothetical protein VGI92_00965 [Gemmatimonadales bacterium]
MEDLLRASAAVSKAFETETLRHEINADVSTSSITSNIDMVVWSRGRGENIPLFGFEFKLILAAHGKARKNRLRDLVAFSNHMHNANRLAVAGGILGINLSAEYANPDPFASGMERHRFNMQKVVADSVGIYGKLPQRNSPEEPFDRPEALGIVLFSYNGKGKAVLVTESPAPQPGEPLHYATFVRRMSEQYAVRHG